MKTYLWFVLACISILPINACTSSQPASAPQPDYRLTFTIREIMESTVEPSADVVWNAVSIEFDEKGARETYPKNDEEWEEVRRHAVTLLEATNLILMPGRRVAKPGEQPYDSRVELHPDQVQMLIDQDRQTWTRFAHGLHDATTLALKAIDAKDRNGLLNSGKGIDDACENCHLKYWYPNQPKSAQ